MAVESFEREKGNSKKKPNGDKAVEKLSSSAKKLKCEMFLIKTFFCSDERELRRGKMSVSVRFSFTTAL
jgi:hypothetical protein